MPDATCTVSISYSIYRILIFFLGLYTRRTQQGVSSCLLHELAHCMVYNFSSWNIYYMYLYTVQLAQYGMCNS